MEYTAQATSLLVNNEVKLTISNTALIVTSLFDTVAITFAEINALQLTDHVVTIKADSGDYVFSRMGSWCQPFYDALCGAYNKAVLRSLFIKDNPILIAKGHYRYTESGLAGCDAVPIHVYKNSVTALPPDLSARRAPLCFVNGIEKGDFELTLKLDTAESYTYAKLGYDTAIFADAVERQIRQLREESLAAVKEIDPTIATVQASQLAKLMPQGAAAPISQLAEISPSFIVALESKVAATRAAESYAVFKELCDSVWVGFRKNESPKDDPTSSLLGTMNEGSGEMPSNLVSSGNLLEVLSTVTNDDIDGVGAETFKQDPYLIWLIAPSPNRRFAAVEFAEANSATFIYRTNGDFSGFAKQLNRALEAINFKREVIRLTDAELRKPENADYYMAAKRTVALQFVRSNFVGRVIHSSPEKWRGNLLRYFEEKTEGTTLQTTSANTCSSCSKANDVGTKFCGECGHKLT